jgi:hypothetical protein
MKDPMFNVIEVASSTFPNLRMGQILLNAIPKERLYYISDDDFMKALWAYIKEHGK